MVLLVDPGRASGRVASDTSADEISHLIPVEFDVSGPGDPNAVSRHRDFGADRRLYRPQHSQRPDRSLHRRAASTGTSKVGSRRIIAAGRPVSQADWTLITRQSREQGKVRAPPRRRSLALLTTDRLAARAH